jgi:uncharacterized protein
VGDASTELHEDAAHLRAETIDRHRASVSLREELEAADWYDQRIDATTDASLAEILRHNRDEEKEHAAMLLEWLRRHDPVLDRHLRTYLFTSAPVTAIESIVDEDEDDGDGDAVSLVIGSLRAGPGAGREARP